MDHGKHLNPMLARDIRDGIRRTVHNQLTCTFHTPYAPLVGER